MDNNPFDLTSRELLSIVFKAKWALIGIFLLFSVGVLGYSYTLTRSYEAVARIFVKSGQEFQVKSDPGQSIAAVPYATKREIVNSEIEILTGRDLALEVIEQIGLKRLYPVIAAATGGRQRPIDAAVQAFQTDFKAVPVDQTDVITASYTNADRELAAAALNLTISRYQRKHAQMFSETRYPFLEQQTQDYEHQLDAIAKRLTDFKNTHSLFDVDAQRTKLIDDRDAVGDVLQQLRSQLIDAHQRIAFLKSKLRSTPALIIAGESPAEAVEQAKARLLDLQVKMQQLQERYVVDVKPMQDAREEMASLSRFIAGKGAINRKQWSQRNPAIDDLTIALNRALADAAPLQQQIALRTAEAGQIQAHLRALEDATRSLGDLEREKSMLEELVHTYRTRYEEARISEDLAKQKIVSVKVLEPAYASAIPVKPRRLLFAVAGVLLGAIGAAGFLIFLLVFRQTLITVESVRRILGMPVVTSVTAR